jgi:hypothetical protein
MDGRVIEWKVERFSSDRRLVIRSQTGCFHVEAPIRDNNFCEMAGRSAFGDFLAACNWQRVPTWRFN